MHRSSEDRSRKSAGQIERRPISKAIHSACRIASATIVKVGLTAALVVY
jgi:hypothetical protein